MARSVYCNYSNTCIICLNTEFKGRLQSKYKFVLKAAFLYVDIPAKTIFSEKFMF